jgi:hypothetical protein
MIRACKKSAFVFALPVLLVTGAACSGSKSAEPETPSTPAAAEPAAELEQPSSAAEAPESNAASAEGATAAPVDADCKFRVKGFCFASEEEACNAADCQPGRCAILDGKPARVKCQ